MPRARLSSRPTGFRGFTDVLGDRKIDFAAAEAFLKEAKSAYQAGDVVRCSANCRLVAVALDLPELKSQPRR